MTLDADEAKLLEAVAADFDADGPRRAYGEWLVAKGNGWGEFVLASLQRAGVKELARLRKAHAKAGLGDVHRLVDAGLAAFERGFPTRVGGDAQWVVRAGREVVLRAPRAQLTVHDARPRHIDALAPICRALPGQQLTTIDFDEAAFLRLASAGILSRFEHARLLFALGDAGLAALIAHGSALRSLALGQVSDPAPLFASRLALGDLRLATGRVTAALRSYVLPVGTLVLQLEDFDDADVEALLAAPAAQHLTWLGLARTSDAATKLTSEAAVRLVRGLARLRVLNLGGSWGLQADAAHEIAGLLSSR